MVQLFLINAHALTIKEHWDVCGLTTEAEILKIRTYLLENQKIYNISFGNNKFLYHLPLHSLIQLENEKILDVLLSKWNKKRDQIYEGFSTFSCNIKFSTYQISNYCFVEISGDFKRCPPVLLEKIIPFTATEISNVLLKSHLFKKKHTIENQLKSKLCLWMHAIFEFEIQ